MGVGRSTKKTAPLTIPEKEFHDVYVLGKKLGRGAFAQVRIANRVNSDHKAVLQEEAVKILDLRSKINCNTIDHRLVRDAQSEARTWTRAASGHSNVVQLREVFFDAKCCYLVMEKCSRGLLQYMEALPEINERSVGNVIMQMLLAISQIHSARVVHRDVKPDNFLAGGIDGSTIKLADFGLSAIMPNVGQIKGSHGTAPFMCPEMLKGQPFDEKADVWSMAVVTYVFLFGTFPYNPKEKCSEAMKQAIVDGRAPTFKPSVLDKGCFRSEKALAFVRTLLERNPEKRLSACAALRMPYITIVKDKQQTPDSDLPCLRPMLNSAKKEGAFEMRDVTKCCDIDDFLDSMQKQRQGVSLPCARSSDNSIFQKLRVAQDVDMLNKSNTLAVDWNDASSVATTASGGALMVQSPQISSSWSIEDEFHEEYQERLHPVVRRVHEKLWHPTLEGSGMTHATCSWQEKVCVAVHASEGFH